jgi:Mannosyltransferase (PIG-V)
MSVETAELAIADTPAERAPSFALPGAAPAPPARLARRIARAWSALRADPLRMAAVHDSWRAVWSSRALVWVAGAGAVATFGFGPVRSAFNPPGVTRGFGWLGDLLAAPAARWDSSWYLVIAHYGYRPDLGALTSSRAAFFPLYPLGLHGVATLGLPPPLAGVMLSLGAFALALYAIHRLTVLELTRRAQRGLRAAPPRDVARAAVMLTAFAPMAFYFSAVYAESLYLALSVGLFLCARQGRWWAVGVLGALAGATRNTGVMLLAPALILYLYGPREDRAPLATTRRLAPRYRVRRDVAWLALIPVGLCVYLASLAAGGGDPAMPFRTQDVWGRSFAGPYAAVWDGVQAAWLGARQLLSLQRSHVYFTAAGGSPFVNAGHNLMLLAFLVATVPAVIGVLRTLPLAYGVYVLGALAMPLSYPVAAQPLMSLPRFLVVLFPLTIWLAAWLSRRPRLLRSTLIGSSALLAFFVAEFATWHWVA